MKNVSLYLIFSLALLVPQFNFAQKLVTAQEVTPKFLKETFENALIDVLEVSDSYIQIKDEHKYYIDIDPDKRYVTISVSYALNPEAKPADIYKFLNIVNKDVALLKAYTNNDFNTISYYYYFWTGAGFTQKSLLESIKLFNLALELCLEKDTLNVL